jgi:phosphomannomutase
MTQTPSSRSISTAPPAFPHLASDLEQRVMDWVAADPDAETQQELRELCARGDEAELRDRFAGPLEFGTAGLRGVLGGGPGRMNLAVVLRTTYALARVLLDDARHEPGSTPLVVIGFDGRRKSREFAEAAAEVLNAQGLRVAAFETTQPTPMVAFTAKRLEAWGGIMVTASHNPPEYNGYKVYARNGAQIIEPFDKRVAQAIQEAPRARDIPRCIRAKAKREGLYQSLEADLEAAYLREVDALYPPAPAARALGPAVYTALHGVGADLVLRLLRQRGFLEVFSVGAQERPDGEFPTVRFPNPEEPGAMDLAFALAKERKAALVLANDPDADRLAVALPARDGSGTYVQLTGNQVGVLLGHFCMSLAERKGSARGSVITSCVSSPMLGVIAKARGFRYDETLTGFKWIANRALALTRDEGLHFVFGYEEALGYTVGELVRDKDGISALGLLVEQADALARQGQTLWDELEALYRAYGYAFSAQLSVTRKGQNGAAELAAMMEKLRTDVPREIGGLMVTAFTDMSAAIRTTYASRDDVGTKGTFGLPRSNVLVFELEGGSRVIARPSGTEPKAKFYFDVRVPFGDTWDASHALAEATHRKLLAAISATLGL